MSLQANKYTKDDEAADALIRSMQTGNTELPATAVGEQPHENPGEQEAVSVGTPADQIAAEPAPATQAADETSKLKDQLAASEQRYRTLQGMMEKVTEDNRELRGTIRDLTDKLQAFMDSQAQRPDDTPAKTLVTEKDEEAFGHDLVDLVRRAARETMQSEIGDIDGKVNGKVEEVSNQVQKVAEQVAANAQERFESQLTAAAPEWREINIDPQFSAFLGPYGLRALNEAYANGDVAGTAQFFSNYNVFTGNQKADASPTVSPSAKLEDLQSPGKTKAATPIPQPQMYTIADWNNAFELNRRGKLSDADLETFEKEFNKAQREGRVAA